MANAREILACAVWLIAVSACSGSHVLSTGDAAVDPVVSDAGTDGGTHLDADHVMADGSGSIGTG